MPNLSRILRIWRGALAPQTDHDSLTVDSAFRIAFDRQMSNDDRRQLASAGSHRLGSGANLLRTVIAAFDRQVYPTPIVVRFGPAQVGTVDFGTFKLIVDADDASVSNRIVRQHDYEMHVRRFVESILRPGMTVLDVGANIGFHTMLFASIVGKEGRVLAFEPNSENCRLLLLSAAENDFPQVKLFPTALADTTGAIFLTSSTGSNGALLPNRRETLMNPNCTVVACDRLDRLVDEKIDFIKLDIEGAEYRALLGGIELIKKWRPMLCVEFSMEMTSRVSGIAGPDFLKWLKSFGYRVFLLRRQGRRHPAEIRDIDRLIADWGDFGRIEDFAFLPDDAARAASI